MTGNGKCSPPSGNGESVSGNGHDSDRDALGKWAPGNSFAAKPGEVRNPTGKTGCRSVVEQIRRMMDEERGGKNLADAIAEKVIQEALKGNFQFCREIIDRVDGKVADKLEARIEQLEVAYVDAPPIPTLRDRSK